ncbi:MAG: glycosyl hydrolase family 28 protein [Thermoguttaceae bacterium]|nr:glycosyl hydrolase family 28 protein [Thermoguttaceae bacterium]
MKRVWLVLMVVGLMLLGTINAMTEEQTSRVVIAPLPTGEKTFDDYEVLVNGKPVPVYWCRVSAVPLNQTWPGYQRPVEQTESAGFARWEMQGTVKVVVRSRNKINSVLVQPRSRKIKTTQPDGNRIAFELTRPGPITVLINGEQHALHLFPVALRTKPIDPKAENTRYFGPGVHDVGILKLKDGQSVYVDAGAVVYGSIQARDCSHVRVEGPGIVDASRLERKKGGGVFWFERCRNVYIGGGIIQRDSNVWSTNIFNCEDVVVSGTALIGHWRYNSDGIDVCNSRRVLVEDAFVRSFDDSLVVKGIGEYKTKETADVLFRNCVLWCDWGRAIKIGTETIAPQIRNIAFEDCDIIKTTHCAMSIDHKDRAAVSHVRYENIRVEMGETMLYPVYQTAKDEKYTRGQEKRSPQLFVLCVAKMNSKDASRGTIRDVLIKNIQVTCSTPPVTRVLGYDAQHDLKGVTIKNLTFNGKQITNEAEMNLIKGKFVDDLRFEL